MGEGMGGRLGASMADISRRAVVGRPAGMRARSHAMTRCAASRSDQVVLCAKVCGTMTRIPWGAARPWHKSAIPDPADRPGTRDCTAEGNP